MDGRYHSQQFEGGKSVQNESGFGFFGLVFVGVSRKNHWRLETMNLCPQPLLFIPLSTTFNHILRLNRLLSIAKFQIETGIGDASREARHLAVNQKWNH